jgi:RepB DNA-primase from phage plasmid
MKMVRQIAKHLKGSWFIVVPAVILICCIRGNMDQTTRFFKRLFARTDGLIELRAFPSGERIFTRDYRQLSRFIKRHLDSDVFFGVATRWRLGGSKADCAVTPALWVDIDWKDFAGGEKEAARHLKLFALPPSIIVCSGHGLHLYWLLEKPVPADSLIESYLKGLAAALQGDRGSAEIARVLRVPGTFNYKRAKSVSVTCVKLSKRRYALEAFDHWKIDEPLAPNGTITFDDDVVAVDLAKFSLSERMRALIDNGWSGAPYKSRSEADMAVITALLKGGAQPDEIRAVFCAYRIGQKYREKGKHGDGYLRRSIGNASTFLAKIKARVVK